MDKTSNVSLGKIFHYSLTFEIFENFWIFYGRLSVIFGPKFNVKIKNPKTIEFLNVLNFLDFLF